MIAWLFMYMNNSRRETENRKGDACVIRERQRMKPVVFGLCLYFVLSATDCFRIGALGSFLKVISIIPVMLMLLDIKRLRFRMHPLFAVNFLFGILGIVSIFFSVDVDVAFSAVVTLCLNLLLVFSLGSFESYTKQEVDAMKRSMLWGGWITIILMLLLSDYTASGRLSLRLGESIQDQNYINGFFLYTFSHHAGCFFEKRKKRHLIPAVFIFVIVLMTGSRGALLAFMMTAFAHICITFRNSRHFLRNILLTVIVMFLAVVVFDIVLSFLPEAVAVRYSWDYIAEKGTTGRTMIWDTLLEHFSQDSIGRMLFGHGFGTCRLVNTFKGYVAHNLYLDNLITLGIVGTVLQVISQCMVAWHLIKHREYGLFAAYIGMIGMCMSLSLVSYKPIWNVMLLTLAIDISRKERVSGNEEGKPLP